MVTRRASRLFLLAALLWLGVIPSAFALRSPGALATAPPENRVGGSDVIPSGRLGIEDAPTPENAMGWEGCAYETASGQFLWLNRDPIGEQGGINLYEFVENLPTDLYDPFGEFVGIDDALEISAADAAIAAGLGAYVGSGRMAHDMQSLGNALAGFYDYCTKSWDRRSPNPDKTDKSKHLRDRRTGKQKREDKPNPPPRPPRRYNR